MDPKLSDVLFGDYSKCTVKSTGPLKHIVVSGEPREFPICPVDNGLITEFHAWMSANKIYTAVPGGMSGGGMYVGIFTMEDAAKIEAWLLEKGVKRK